MALAQLFEVVWNDDVAEMTALTPSEVLAEVSFDELVTEVIERSEATGVNKDSFRFKGVSRMFKVLAYRKRNGGYASHQRNIAA